MSTSKSNFPSNYPESSMKKTKSIGDDDNIKLDFKSNKLNFNSLNSTVEYINSPISTRKDKFGNPIIKKKKTHKISFSDQFKNERSLVQISKVQSYKNIISEDKEKKCLNCIIF